MAIKWSFFAVYASQIRKRPEWDAVLTQSPARTGGLAMHGGLRPLFRARGKTSADTIQTTAGHGAGGRYAGRSGHCLARTQGAPCAPPGIARPPPGRAMPGAQSRRRTHSGHSLYVPQTSAFSPGANRVAGDPQAIMISENGDRDRISRRSPVWRRRYPVRRRPCGFARSGSGPIPRGPWNCRRCHIRAGAVRSRSAKWRTVRPA